MIKAEYVSSCNHCCLGNKSRRGIVKITRDDAEAGVFDERVIYECAIEEYSCTIPRLYQAIRKEDRLSFNTDYMVD